MLADGLSDCFFSVSCVASSTFSIKAGISKGLVFGALVLVTGAIRHRGVITHSAGSTYHLCVYKSDHELSSELWNAFSTILSTQECPIQTGSYCETPGKDAENLYQGVWRGKMRQIHQIHGRQKKQDSDGLATQRK